MWHYAKGDTDLLIVKTTVKLSAEADVVLVGDDTDLLVLLCHHVGGGAFKTFFYVRTKKQLFKVTEIREYKLFK